MMPSKTPRLFYFSVLPYLTCWLFILILFPHECRVDSEAPGFREKKEKRGHQRTISLTLTPLKGSKTFPQAPRSFPFTSHWPQLLTWLLLFAREIREQEFREEWLPTSHCLPYTGRLMLLKVPTAGKCGFWISNWVSFPKLVPSPYTWVPSSFTLRLDFQICRHG